MIQDAWGWCTGMTQRDGTRREVGGGYRKGNTCTPVAGSCARMAKPIPYSESLEKMLDSLALPPSLLPEWHLVKEKAGSLTGEH